MDKLNSLFGNYLEQSINFIRNNCKEIISTVNNNLA